MKETRAPLMTRILVMMVHSVCVQCMNLLFLSLSVGVEDDVPAAMVIGEDGVDDNKADKNTSKNNSAAVYLLILL